MDSAAASPLPPQLKRLSPAAGGAQAALSGDWTLLALSGRLDSLGRQLQGLVADGTQRWDLSGVSRLDSTGALVLWRAWGERRPELAGTSPEQDALFAQFPLTAPAKPTAGSRPATLPAASASDQPDAGARPGWFAPFDAAAEQLLGAVSLAGQLLLDSLYLLRHPGDIPWREFSANLFRTGTQALAITALVGFLVGVTISYLMARQLQAYGADIFVINILGLSIPRELGPLIAAIIVAGRSGSSMTAQLGVMRVTQELDALSVLGISHTMRLVLPKVVALAIALPLVVVWTSLVMLIGGMLAAEAELGIDPVRFIQGLPAAVPIANLYLGWSKAMMFGALIALVACHFGLRILPNTESLGAGVTKSVVVAITVVIIVDALFAVAFSNVGI